MVIPTSFWKGVALATSIWVAPYLLFSAFYFISSDTFGDGVAFAIFFCLALEGIKKVYIELFKR